MTRPNLLRLQMACAFLLLVVAPGLQAQKPTSLTQGGSSATHPGHVAQSNGAVPQAGAAQPADQATTTDPATGQPAPEAASSSSQPAESSSTPATRLLPYLPSALLGLTVVLLLARLLRKHAQPANGEDEFLTGELSELKRDADRAKKKFLELDEEYNRLDAQYESLNMDFKNLERDYNRQTRELADGRPSLAGARRDPDPRDDEPKTRQDFSRPAPEPEKAFVMSDDPPASLPMAAEAPALPTAGVQPLPSFGTDPQRDYLQALENPDLQPEFRRLHSPFGVSCRNLGQRTLAGASLILERDSQVRSLFAVSLPSKILIFPGFSVDAGNNRGMLEGIYTFPADFSELTVATAASAEPRGDLFYLTRPGTFRNG